MLRGLYMIFKSEKINVFFLIVGSLLKDLSSE